MAHFTGGPKLATGVAALAVLSLLTQTTRPALAQEPDAEDALKGAPPSGTGIEEIVVTARRRNEDIQTVPIAITHFSAEDLKSDAVETVVDLQRFVPSLTALNATNRDSNQLSIRGIPGVVAYFAEAPVVSALSAASSGSGSGIGPGLYYDLQDVEVLKGPQSTLFGGTTTGGAILFSPKKPTSDYEGYGQVTFGDYADKEVEAAVNVPIVAEKLMVRIAGQTQQRDGFTLNIINHKDLDNRDYYAARIGVSLEPSDDVDNYLVYSSFYNDSNGSGEKLTAVRPGSDAALAFGQPLFAALALQQQIGPRETALDTSEIDKEYTYRLVDVAQWRASDNVTLRNIAAYTVSKYLFRWDLDGSPLPIIASTNPNGWSNSLASYSEEPQLQGKARDDNLIWTAGGFLQFTHPAGYYYVQSIEFDTPLNTFIKNPLTQAGQATTKEQAVYAQATYDLGDVAAALDGLKATGGYRYSWDYASNLQNSYNALGVCQAQPPQRPPSLPLLSVPFCANGISGNFAQGTWTLALDYQLTADTLFYATGRRGYNPGGFNAYAPSPNLRSYQPEHLIDIELGVKSNWNMWDMPIHISADAFHDAYSNIQRETAVVASSLSTITENAAQATLEGIEFEGKINPIKGVELSGFYAYANSRYDKYISPTAGNLSGLPFTGGPRNQYNTTARYHLPIGSDLGDASVAATFSFQGHVQFSDRELGGIIPAHGLLDVRMDWENVANRPIDASFFMTNATDQVYIAGGTIVYAALGVNPVLYGEPRMWGFQLRYRFGPKPAAGL